MCHLGDKNTVFLANGSHLIKDCFHPLSTVAFLWYTTDVCRKHESFCFLDSIEQAKINSVIGNAIKETYPNLNVVCLRCCQALATC